MKAKFEINTTHSVRRAIAIGAPVSIATIASLFNNPTIVVGTALIV